MKNLLNKMKNKIVSVKNFVKKGIYIAGTPLRKLEKTRAGQVLKKGIQTIGRIIKIPFIGYLLLACILNITMEALSRHSLVEAFVFICDSPLVFLYNAFIIFVTLSLVLFAKRKFFATIFVCAIWIISAFANFIVLCFRTTPFSAVDMLMLRNVMTMLDKYMTKWQMALSAIGIVLVIALLIYLYIRLPKTKSKRRPLRASAYVCMCFFLIITLTKVAVETQTISDNFGNLAYAYNDYGFAYCFSNSIIDVGISKPKDYSEETIKEIVDGLEYDKSEVILVTKEEEEAVRKAEQEAVEADNNTTSDQQTEDNETGSIEEKQGIDVVDHSETSTEVEKKTAEQNTADGRPDQETSEDETLVDTNTVAQDENSKSTGTEVTYYENEKATKEHPNIIVIQLESIFDTKYMKDFHVSEDPMPMLTRLKQQYSTGLFTVPAVGAGTANTEFEVQTGMSTQFFGAGEYPFKTVMKDVSCDSIGYDLKRLGYATSGFHNNDATFYERYIDYSNLGFDSFSGMEHMYMLNYTPRGWAKDDVLDDIMLERMEQTSGRDYITTISVQAHGRYPKKYTETLTNITCYFTGKYAEDQEKRAAWTYYINMCRETDNMVASLIYKLEKLDEPTVVFMYGDHLPSLNLEETDLDGISLYQTEWIMWDNIGLSVEKKDMAAYQASTYIFNRLGLPGGLMQNFHNQYMQDTDEEDYLHKLELLEYDTLYGNNYAYDQVNPFPQTDMQMGIRDIYIAGYEIVEEEVRIHGSGFNEFSVVYVDGKSVETQYINYETLSIPIEELKDGKEFYIAQAGDDHVVLSVTDSMLFEAVDTGDAVGENPTGVTTEE